MLVVPVAVGAFGYVLPNILLYNAGQKREKLMQRALPDALDLLTISVEAGLGFDAAVMRVAKNTTGPLAQEFSRLLQEMQIGVGRMAAMRAMAERSTLADLKSFCLAMVQADQLGIPIGRVLRIQSHEMRVKRRQRAEEKAQKVPVKIMVPLVLFILPCLFIVVIGPAAIRIVGVFSTMSTLATAEAARAASALRIAAPTPRHRSRGGSRRRCGSSRSRWPPGRCSTPAAWARSAWSCSDSRSSARPAAASSCTAAAAGPPGSRSPRASWSAC